MARLVDLRQRVRDLEQLRSAIGRLRDHSPLKEWMACHFKYHVHNGKSLQWLFSQNCGDCALMFLIDQAEVRSGNDFLNRFKNAFVENDHKVRQMSNNLIVDELTWCQICKTPCQQGTQGPLDGVHHLLS